MLKVACVSLEGVLAPPVWSQIGRIAGIPELFNADRVEADYTSAMQRRISLVYRHGLTLDDMEFIVSMFEPLKGAAAFLKSLQSTHRVIIFSDTFPELTRQFTQTFHDIEVYCHCMYPTTTGLVQDCRFVSGYSKTSVVKHHRRIGHETLAIGNGMHDLGMLRSASRAFLYRPSRKIQAIAADLPVVTRYRDIQEQLAALPGNFLTPSS
jgi:bifunctional phosphoserine phosphatase/homoserine phosphotransferase